MQIPKQSTLRRGAAGIIAGTALGVLIEVVYAENFPVLASYPIFCLGPILWATTLSSIFVVAGWIANPLDRNIVFRAFLAGMLVGPIIAATVYPEFRMRWDGAVNDSFGYPMALRDGAFVGMPVGACIGLLIGVLIVRYRRAGQNHHSGPQDDE